MRIGQALGLGTIAFFALAGGEARADTCVAAREQPLNCTANDTAVQNVSVTNGVTQCIANQPILLDVQITSAAGNSQRDDLGIFFPNDGLNPIVLPANGGSASCDVFTLPNAPIPAGAADLDGDACPEVPSNGTTTYTLTGISALCVADANGELALPIASVWQQSNEVCNGPADVAPGTPAKCGLTTLLTQIVVGETGTLTVDKVTAPDPANATVFPFVVGGIVADPNITTGPTNFNLASPDPSQVVQLGIINSVTGTTFSLTETPQPGFIVQSIVCTLNSNPETIVAQTGSGVATIQLPLTVATKDITCVVTNAPPPGDVTVTKTVTGDVADGYNGGTFDITLNCGGTITELDLADGGSQTIQDVPAGVECTVSEGDPSGAANPGYAFGTPALDFTPDASPCAVPADNCFVIQPGSTITAAFTNDVQALPGSVGSITKILNGEPEGYEGQFTITVGCPLDSQLQETAVLGDGDTDNSLPALASVPTDPAANCDVEETLPEPPEAYAFTQPTVVITFTGGAGGADVNCSITDFAQNAGCPFTIPPGSVANVTVTNTLQPTNGSLTLSKNVTGETQALVSGGPEFSITGSCATDPVTTVTGQLQDGELSVASAGVPQGTICRVYEASPLPTTGILPGYTFGTPTISLSNAGAGGTPTLSACDPAQASTVVCQQFTMPAGAAITATVANPLSANPGVVSSITKVLTGAGSPAGYVAASTFPITVSCSDESQQTVNPQGLSPNNVVSSPANLQSIDADAECSVSEGQLPAPTAGYSYGTPSIVIVITDAAGATTQESCSNAGPCDFTMPAGGSAAVTVTNVLSANPGNVTSVTKTVTGSLDGLVPGSDFTITVTCGTQGADVNVLENGQSDAGPQQVPAGDVCVISEGALPAAAQNYFYGTPTIQVVGAPTTNCTSAPGGSRACRQFTMPPGGSIQVTVTNVIQFVPVSIPTLSRSALLALIGLTMLLGLVAVPRVMRGRV